MQSIDLIETYAYGMRKDQKSEKEVVKLDQLKKNNSSDQLRKTTHLLIWKKNPNLSFLTILNLTSPLR